MYQVISLKLEENGTHVKCLIMAQKRRGEGGRWGGGEGGVSKEIKMCLTSTLSSS